MIVAHQQQAAMIAPGHVFVIAAPARARPLPTMPAAPPGLSPIDDDTPV